MSIGKFVTCTELFLCSFGQLNPDDQRTCSPYNSFVQCCLTAAEDNQGFSLQLSDNSEAMGASGRPRVQFSDTVTFYLCLQSYMKSLVPYSISPHLDSLMQACLLPSVLDNPVFTCAHD